MIRSDLPIVLVAMVVAALVSVGLLWIDEWNIYSFGAGIAVGGMIAAAAMLAERSSAGQNPR